MLFDEVLDKGNSVLTDNQRKFLLKSPEERESDYSRQGRSYHWNSIRDRAQAAMFDLALLFAKLDEPERRRIFDADRDPLPLSRALEYTFGFLYLGTLSFRANYPGVGSFEHHLERGIRKAENKRRGSSNRRTFVDIEIRHEGRDFADIGRLVELMRDRDTDELTDEEIRAFHEYLSETDGFDELLQAVKQDHDASDTDIETTVGKIFGEPDIPEDPEIPEPEGSGSGVE